MANQKKGLVKLNSRNLAFIVAAIIIVIAIFALSKKVTEKPVVKIGFVGNVSKGGLAERNVLEAAKMAAEDANKVYNKRFELVVYDVKDGKKETIENAFKSASRDGISAIVTTTRSRGSALEEKMPTVYVSKIKDESIERQKFYWGIRLLFIESDHINQHMGAIKSRYKISAASFVTDDEIWAAKNFTKRLVELNELGASYYTFNSSNLQEVLNEIKAKKPDIVAILASTAHTIEFLRASKENGLDSILFLAFDYTNIKYLAEEENMPTRFLLAPPPDDTVGPLESQTNAFGQFSQRLLSSTGKRAGLLELNAYDAVSVLAQSIVRATSGNAPIPIEEEREGTMRELWATRSFQSLKGTLMPNGITGYFVRENINTYYINRDELKFKPAKDVGI